MIFFPPQSSDRISSLPRIVLGLYLILWLQLWNVFQGIMCSLSVLASQRPTCSLLTGAYAAKGLHDKNRFCKGMEIIHMRHFAYFITSRTSWPLSTAGFKEPSTSEPTALEHTASKQRLLCTQLCRTAYTIHLPDFQAVQETKAFRTDGCRSQVHQINKISSSNVACFNPHSLVEKT